MMFEIRINKGGKERDVVIKQHFPNFNAIRKKKNTKSSFFYRGKYKMQMGVQRPVVY